MMSFTQSESLGNLFKIHMDPAISKTNSNTIICKASIRVF